MLSSYTQRATARHWHTPILVAFDENKPNQDVSHTTLYRMPAVPHAARVATDVSTFDWQRLIQLLKPRASCKREAGDCTNACVWILARDTMGRCSGGVCVVGRRRATREPPS